MPCTNRLPNPPSSNLPRHRLKPHQPPQPRPFPTPPVLSAEDRATLTFFRGTTLNFGLDGYYEYNFNQPFNHVNQLRADDVSSNSFSINQATVMVEHLPQPLPNQRFGGRIDLQFGQATETLQGSSANELRPQVWRNLFQATVAISLPSAPVFDMDFGKLGQRPRRRRQLHQGPDQLLA